MKRLSDIDIAIILIYLVGILILGFFLGRRQKTDEDYFLGGRKLKWWMVGISLVVSDIGALELMGVSGMTYIYGFSTANYDWMACILPMVIAAFVFIPFFWRAHIYTIPEYLGRRYNAGVRTLVALIWGCFMVANLGIFLYVVAKALKVLVGWDDTVIIGGWEFNVSIWVTAFVVGTYTFCGGLRAVVFTDVIQYIVLVLGSIFILGLSWFKVGGHEGLVAAIDTSTPEREYFFNTILPVDSPAPLTWPAVLFGLVFVLGPAYWTGNQAIVQRCLGTGSERDAKKSVIFGAFLKSTIPFIIAVPGLLGLALFPGLEDGDDIYPTMVNELLPAGVAGLVFAGFLAALMSSVDSYLNSAATLWTMDIYHKYVHRDADHVHLFRVGKLLTIVFIILAAFLAPITEKFPGIFSAFITLLSIFQGPTFALIFLGMLWKRANGIGGVCGLIVGVATSSTLTLIADAVFTNPDPSLYVAWWAFVAAVSTTVVVSLLTPPKPIDQIKDLMFRRIA